MRAPLQRSLHCLDAGDSSALSTDLQRIAGWLSLSACTTLLRASPRLTRGRADVVFHIHRADTQPVKLLRNPSYERHRCQSLARMTSADLTADRCPPGR